MISPPVLLFGANLAALTLLRAAFFVAFRPHPIAAPDLAQAFYLGLKFGQYCYLVCIARVKGRLLCFLRDIQFVSEGVHFRLRIGHGLR